MSLPLRKLDPALLECDYVPQLGSAPPLPAEEVAEKLAALFGVANTTITAEPASWRPASRLLGGLGTDAITLPVHCSPIDSPLFFAIGAKEVEKIHQLLLGSKESAAALDEEMSKALLLFALCEAMELLEEADYPGPSFQLRLGEPSELPEEPALSIDFHWSVQRRKIKGRILLPRTFHRRWVERFAGQCEPSKEQLEGLPITLHMEIGESEVSLDEWKKAKPGDLLLLDRLDRARATITSGEVVLATATIEDEGFRIDG